MDKILDFSTPLDIKLFDEIVCEALNPSSTKKEDAEIVLMKFKEHPNGWARVDEILKNSSSPQSHFFALQALEHAVKTKWFIFSLDQRNGLKTYVIQKILSIDNESYVLNRFNIILVEILKRDWPKYWPDFISNLIHVSQSVSISVCRNSLLILKRLNEDIFIYRDELTTVKKERLQLQLKNEFPIIFQLIKTIFQSKESTLIEINFDVFKSYCKWMDYSFVFDTDIIDLILEYLNSNYSVCTISCLREILDNRFNSYHSDNLNYDETIVDNALAPKVANYMVPDALKGKVNMKIIEMHRKILDFLKIYFTKFGGDRIQDVYPTLDSQEKEFVKESSFFLSSIYESHFEVLENDNPNLLKYGLKILIELSKIEEDIIFKRNLYFLNIFISCLYSECPYQPITQVVLRRAGYKNIINLIFDLLVTKMVRPEEVFITQNEYGEIIKEKLTELEKIDHFKMMKGVLYKCSFINGDYTNEYFKVVFRKLKQQFSYELINKSCWAVGAISGSLGKNEEDRFFVAIIKELLNLCEFKESKGDKAILAANIIYIIGQYDRFLVSNTSFLQVLVMKIFEFFNESYEGIQDMACDTFLKITDKCKEKIVTLKHRDQDIIIYIILNINNIAKSLMHYQKRIVFEGVCNLIKASTNPQTVQMYSNLFVKNLDLNIFLAQCQNVKENPFNVETINELSHIINSYAILFTYIPDTIENSYGELEKLMYIYECHVNPLINNDIVNLLSKLQYAKINSEFLGVIFSKVILDFDFNPLILNLAAEIVDQIKLRDMDVAFIVNTLIIPTITRVFDSNENFDLSFNYFKTLKALLLKEFDITFNVLFSGNKGGEFMKSVLFGLNSIQILSEEVIEILSILLERLFNSKNFLFFKTHYFSILENILGGLVDKDKIFCFPKLARILVQLLEISISVPSFNGVNDNKMIVTEYLCNALTECFGNITKESIQLFCSGCFNLYPDEQIFYDHVKDFKAKVYEFECNEDYEEDCILERNRSAFVRSKYGFGN